jgi:hypothetical protein
MAAASSATAQVAAQNAHAAKLPVESRRPFNCSSQLKPPRSLGKRAQSSIQPANTTHIAAAQ